MSEIVARRVRESDAGVLVGLIELFHQKVKPSYPVSQTLTRMGEPSSMVWVAEWDGVVVGYLWAYQDGPASCFMAQFQCPSDAAETLTAFALKDVLALGFRVATMVALRDGWVRFFRKWGFVPTGVVMVRVLPPRELTRLPDLPDEIARGDFGDVQYKKEGD